MEVGGKDTILKLSKIFKNIRTKATALIEHTQIDIEPIVY